MTNPTPQETQRLEELIQAASPYYLPVGWIRGEIDAQVYFMFKSIVYNNTQTHHMYQHHPSFSTFGSWDTIVSCAERIELLDTSDTRINVRSDLLHAIRDINERIIEEERLLERRGLAP